MIYSNLYYAMLFSAVATARGVTFRAGGRAAPAGFVAIRASTAASSVTSRNYVQTTTTPTPPPSHHSRRQAHRCHHHCHHHRHLRTVSGGRSDGGWATRQLFSTGGNDGDENEGDDEVSCPNKTGDRNGLIRHQIAAEDGHPLRLYSRAPRDGDGDDEAASLLATGGKERRERSILLLHGRTWSSQPVFDLRTSDDDAKRQSTLQSLADLGFHAYALDLRGFGETPRDYRRPVGGYTTPRRCVADVKCAIDWIAERHRQADDASAGEDDQTMAGYPAMENPRAISYRPALLGWSQGALVAQMYAQRHGPATLSDLVLFGSIYDPGVIYPRKPLYDPSGRIISGGPDVVKPPPPEAPNTDVDSLEDFTLPGTICDEAALCYSRLALQVDPIKAAWDEMHEFNVLNPAMVHVPTLVVVGAQDPYTSWDAQRVLFERLGTEDKAMCVLPGCDHAAHILKARRMFVRAVVGFLLRKDDF
eukprot:CAMPEP_0172555380 /NCGR_PEP_ID=MMETSP1067-20121228/58385_1 /TAXON_ID=265564 ORGANISM="Thalassiosira punctigera, Strain Tpunct2005C2" /NCGR_SAMPLE_ID=MMETSP1067 /ASSEMBLY_ACC=CAM_ASM_000444 /LENGTH=474 /DNA_ID=CAMNT_0013343897 /DNA_START=76 /DNA_END=1500 /DNA_ORIENTATION=-